MEDYEVLFKMAFPEWFGPIPPLPDTLNITEDENFTNQQENVASSENEKDLQDNEPIQEENISQQNFLSSSDDLETNEIDMNELQEVQPETHELTTNEDIIPEDIPIPNENTEENDLFNESEDIEVFLWEITSDNGSRNNAYGKQRLTKQYPQKISEIKIYRKDGECFESDGNDDCFYNAINIIPNVTWVFALDPKIGDNYAVIDPFVLEWLLSTESFEECDALMPLNKLQNLKEESKIVDLIERSLILWETIKKENLYDWYINTELPHLRVMGQIHQQTFKLDISAIKMEKMRVENDQKLVSSQIYEMSGEKFNILSPFEVSNILYDKMKLGPKNILSDSKIDSRHRTTHHREFAPTNLDALNAINHPIVDLIKKYRSLNKLSSNWLSFDEKADFEGYLHPWLLICSTATGRISTVNPNLQNIPAVDENLNIRKFFKPPNKSTLLSVDYSQLELRILAHFSCDSLLVSLCKMKDVDIHTMIARQLFSTSSTTPQMRDEAKTAVYATIYGKRWGNDKYSQMSNVLDAFPGINAFINRSLKQAKTDKQVKTFSGKIRKLPNLDAKGSDMRRDERIAVNTIIQGSAADFVKFALLKVMKETGLVPILQLHDEWLFETDEVPGTDGFKKLIDDLRKSAECAEEFGFKVPIPVKISAGPSFGELKEIIF